MRAPRGRRDEQRADRLVERGERQRDPASHRGDAEQDLRPQRGVDRDRGAAVERLDPPRQQNERHHHHPRPPAVDKVDQIRVMREREQRPAAGVDPRGDEAVVHQRPARRDLPRVEPRDPRPHQQLAGQEQRRGDTDRRQPRRPLRPRCQPPQVERGPHQPREQEQSRQQMRRQPEMADVGAVGEPRLDHVPPQRPLERHQQRQRA